ncbi:4Fe-4S dicluster domain-containing protein [Desulfovermiculus halophilus]|uniref:4Fe-4S dicluster domain-containing protein n=1 Tax=Desulfovermiculus halophilus TaxID=339722 RepID=UPI00048994E8|nr:4Fe-4S dicluster domain-containing protein [Desulfovermiculus halophilus]
MAAKTFLTHDDIPTWLDTLRDAARVLVPTDVDGTVKFEAYDSEREIILKAQATAPPKEAVFPQTETLLRYRYYKDPEHPETQSVDLKEDLPEDKVVVFGARPCGTRGFVIYDRVFATDAITDPYYKARRDNTAFITIACDTAEHTCFCHWVGSHPADSEGSDVVLHPVQDGYVAHAVTEKGEQLLEQAGGQKASSDQEKEAQAVQDRVMEELGEAPDLSGVPASLLQIFDNLDFWNDVSAKCISCGACTYLCPTCYCFNITDESYGLSGKRIRTWDNCMSYLFTLEGSGHNPRMTKAHRLRNRVGHKFSYYPELHGGVFACCGCGRCIKHCPMAVDIREIILRAKETADEQSVSA